MDFFGRKQLLTRRASRQQQDENQAPHSRSPVSALLAIRFAECRAEAATLALSPEFVRILKTKLGRIG
jgi:hypothetical protein